MPLRIDTGCFSHETVYDTLRSMDLQEYLPRRGVPTRAMRNTYLMVMHKVVVDHDLFVIFDREIDPEYSVLLRRIEHNAVV